MMASGGRRIFPIDEMEVTSPPIATGANGLDNLVTTKESASFQITANSPSRLQTLEEAYWTSKQKHAGIRRFHTTPKYTDDPKNLIHKNMELYVGEHFHQKECFLFVPKPNQKVNAAKNLKCHCGEILSMHVWGRSDSPTSYDFVHSDYIQIVKKPTEKPPDEMKTVKWTSSENIKVSPSHTYGRMTFNVEMVGGKKPAKYIRVSDNDSVDACLEMMTKFWRIMDPFPPNLVISIVGGAKNFRLDGEMRDTFSSGLIKAAKTTNAWLITSGFNMGVMKAVGQAVHEGQAFLWDNDRMVHLIRCIAIAPWGYVYNRRSLEQKGNPSDAYYRTSNQILHGKPVPLNPYHTHFIFVDDGYRNRYGGAAGFRAKFEKQIYTPKSEHGYGIPVVMLLLEGGTDAILDASQSLKEGIPVVVCSGTGRAADLLTYAHKILSKDRSGKHMMSEQMRKKLEDNVSEAYRKNWGDKVEEELEKVMANIDACLERESLMIFFDLRRDEDLDVAILSVLTKAEAVSGAQNHFKQLELALTWNRADIAQSEIFREDINWKTEELNEIMTKALLDDKMDFVRLLHNQGVSMKEYLTAPRLEELYNKIPKHHFLYDILKRHSHKSDFELEDIGAFLVTILDRYDDDKLTPNVKRNPKRNISRRDTAKSFRSRRLIETDTEPEEEAEQFKRPYKQLLIWAVLLNRPRLAQFFWEMGEEPITSALSCTQLCVGLNKLIPKHLSTIKAEFLEMKTMFEVLATKVLDECHASSPDKAIMLVERQSPIWSHLTCLQIAAAANDQAFVSSAGCQNSINSSWKNGVLADWRRVLVTAVFPALIFFVIEFVDIGNRKLGPCQKIFVFFTSPITTFAYFTMSYITFLGLYTYMLLVDFHRHPSALEYVLMVWIFCLFVGELHTLLAFPSATLKRKLQDSFTILNWLELVNMVLAFVSFGLRINDVFYTEAKTIYCTNVVIFYIRIIQVYTSNSHLGPKLYMIIRMVEQLVMFLLVLIVFLVAYGVASQGLLYHRRIPDWAILRDVIYYPYFQLFGELFLDEFQTDNTCTSVLGNGTDLAPYDNTCRTYSGLVPVLLGLYLLVVNVLLLNLLIAIFSHVFETVEKNAVEIWKFQMYFLVMEFQTRVKLPPPASIFLHIYSLCKWLWRKIIAREKQHAEQYQQRQLEYLALFEKEMMANYLRRVKSESMDSVQVKFTKLQKRVDLLTKQIEDRHIEDDKQGTIHFSDSFKANTLREELWPKSQLPKELIPDAKVAGKPPRPSVSEKDILKKEKHMETADHKENPLNLNLQEKEEKKKHKKKKQKKKHKDEVSQELNLEKKELNINITEADFKHLPEKKVSEEHSVVGTKKLAHLSPSHEESGVLFHRPDFASPMEPKRNAESLSLGDESDLDEAVERQQRSPQRRKSRGSLNALAQSQRTMQLLEDTESSSEDNAYRRKESEDRKYRRKTHRRHKQTSQKRNNDDS